MNYLSPLILGAAGLIIIMFFINQGNLLNRDNNVYVRYIACALSIEPEERTEEVIEACWDHVIEEANREVHRYDKEEDMHPWLKSQ